MRDDRVTITVTGKDEYVTVGAFLKVVHNTLDVLRDVDANISGKRSGVMDWRIVAVSLNSPLTMTIYADPIGETDIGRQVVLATTRGIQQIEENANRIPPNFSSVSLQKAKELVSVLNDGIQRIALGTPWEDPVVPTQHLAANADALLPKPHEEHGSMEGRLETLSVHGGSTFAIWDAMSGQRIECHFPSTMLPEAQEAFNRRVLVSGIIRYSSEGRAKSIIVEKLRPLRGQEELPQIDAIQPINITDGTDSAEYVRRLRDANPEGLLGHLPLHRSTAADARTH